jgi:GNAT superfamily N-acetyltransferase
MTFSLRAGAPADIPVVLALIKQLAEYEKAPLEVSNTPEQMLIDGFSENPIFHLIVAETTLENNQKIMVGMAITYYRYSTWKGRVLYLEDLYILPEYRRFGLGERFFTLLLEKAKQDKCQRVSWQVLDWNEPAINFYKKLGATLDPEWINGFIEIS